MNLNNCKISIIVPVYNVEKYLHKCIDSILLQNLNDVEIILIDDGSTDNSGKICDDYSKKNSFIKVIHQCNKGVSEARNVGIKESNGKYIMFLDSDDFINSNVKLNSIIDSLSGDVIEFKFVYYYENNDKYIYMKDFEIENNNDINIMMYNAVEKGYFSSTVTNKFLKRSIIIDNNILFNKKLTVGEDLEWILEFFKYAKNYKFINEDIYVYRQQRKGSSTSKTLDKNIDCVFYVIKKWYNYNFKNEDLKNTYLSFLAYHYLIIVSQLNKKNCTNEKKREIYEYNDILKYSSNRKVKLCNKLIRIVGFKFSLLLMRNYIRLKNKGIVKI